MDHLEPSAKRIVLFNHKGGVGKTTLTVNIASALAEMGKSVLLVDTDPQCSLSSVFLNEQYLDRILSESESKSGITIWSSVLPIAEGTGTLRSIPAVKLSDDLRFRLIVGDIRLAHFESTLAEAWTQCLSRNRRGFICTSAISNLITQYESETKTDFVFYDSGPNIGPLNRAILLDCDYFIVPVACDLFSLRALKTLGFALTEWTSIWERIREIAPDNVPLLRGAPRLLGFIPQGFRIYRNEMAAAPLQYLDQLESRINEFVRLPLDQVYPDSARTKEAPARLGDVKYFGGLVTQAHDQGAALWNVSGGNATYKKEAKDLFREIAAKVLEHST